MIYHLINIQDKTLLGQGNLMVRLKMLSKQLHVSQYRRL